MDVETYEQLLASSNDCMVLLDQNGIQHYVSGSVTRLLGFAVEEVTGIPVIERLLHPGDQAAVLAAFQRVLGGEAATVSYRHLHKDGHWVWLEARASNQLHNPAVRGILVTTRDISERRAAEEEREKLQARLAQAQKLDSLGVLAGGIAHDFNNLMSGVFGCIDLAMETSSQSEVTQRLAMAMTALGRARALTQQLLTFAKGGTPVQKVGALYPFVLETAHFALSGANVACRGEFSPDLWPCSFDRNQLAQVVENLVINAKQAMPEGGTVVMGGHNVLFGECEHPLLPSGFYVALTVSDTGIGIPAALLPKVFDPFFTTKTQGQGLGLATSYSIVHRHGGCIEVTSEPGVGSTFTVYLPALPGSKDTAVGEAEARHAGCGTFLVMDDEAIVRDTLGVILESFGYTVVCREDGAAALAFLEDHPEVVAMIFDLTVRGGMGGQEAVARLRARGWDVPIFVASGYADDPVMTDPAAWGFTASLSKPFRRSDLAAMLNAHVKSGKSGVVRSQPLENIGFLKA